MPPGPRGTLGVQEGPCCLALGIQGLRDGLNSLGGENDLVALPWMGAVIGWGPPVLVLGGANGSGGILEPESVESLVPTSEWE